MTTAAALGPSVDVPSGVVERARRGDQEAFAAVIRHYDPGLRALAYRLLGDRDLMDDALQEAYVKAFRGLPRFRGRSRLGTWLYRIVYNACLDELKRPGRRRSVPYEDVEESPGPWADPGEAVARRADLAEETLTGELVARGPGFEGAYGWTGTQRWRFALTARGDFRLTGLTLEENVAYDAERGVQRSLNPSASLGGDGPLFASERRGLAPGPPDPAPIDPILENDYGAFVRALLAAEDPRVREAAYRGRPAWRLDVPAAVNQIVPEHSGDRFAIWVDRETGIPVRVLELKNGQPLDELRIEKLAVDEPLPRRTFALRFPEGAEVMRSDEGFRRVSLDEAAAAVGYAPLVPAWVPEGFELAEVTVAPGVGSPTGVEAGNSPSTDVVSLSFRRGLDQLLVTTRLRHVPGRPDAWSDPLATGEGYVDEPEPVRLGRGALSGVEANVLIVPQNVPHLWAQTDDLVVTVGGGVSRAELLRVAESLEGKA